MSVSSHFAFQVVLCALLSITLWVACAGIGLQILPRGPRADHEPASRRQPGVAACVGLGALLMIGGIAVVLRIPWWLYVVPFVVIGLTRAVRELVGLDPGRGIPRSAFILGMLAVAAFGLVAVVQSMVGLRFPLNRCDDLRAYLPMAHRLLDTYGLDEPWSVRRAESLGGFDLLRAFPVAAFGNAGVGVAETAIASIFLAGMFVANGFRSIWTRMLGVGLILAVPLVWVPRVNTTGVLLGSPLFVAVLATTAELRGALRVGDRRGAARWAVAGGLLIAAFMSVRPNLGLLGALIVGLGALSATRSPFSDRVLVLVIGGASTVIAVVSWSFAMWQTVGTPLYPLFSGNLNSSALRGPSMGGLAHRAGLAFDLIRSGPYLWAVLGVLVVGLAARRLLPDAPLMAIASAATVIVTTAVALNTPLLAPVTFARYVAPMSEGLAVFLIYEIMRSADAIPRRVAARRFAWAPPVLAVSAAITLAAGAYSTVGLKWELLPSGARIVEMAARNNLVGPTHPTDTRALRDSYRQALASVTGDRTIAAVDRPYLIDYRRFDIPSLDAPGFMTPDGSFPFFTGPGPKIAMLRRAGFDILLVTDPNDEVCLNPARITAPARGNGAFSGIYRRFLDWDQDIQSIEHRAPAAVRRFGTLLRIDLRLAQAELAV